MKFQKLFIVFLSLLCVMTVPIFGAEVTFVLPELCSASDDTICYHYNALGGHTTKYENQGFFATTLNLYDQSNPYNAYLATAGGLSQTTTSQFNVPFVSSDEFIIDTYFATFIQGSLLGYHLYDTNNTLRYEVTYKSQTNDLVTACYTNNGTTINSHNSPGSTNLGDHHLRLNISEDYAGAVIYGAGESAVNQRTYTNCNLTGVELTLHLREQSASSNPYPNYRPTIYDMYIYEPVPNTDVDVGEVLYPIATNHKGIGGTHVHDVDWYYSTGELIAENQLNYTTTIDDQEKYIYANISYTGTAAFAVTEPFYVNKSIPEPANSVILQLAFVFAIIFLIIKMFRRP